jgi:N-acetylmuramoyl-L-alanine amidase
MFPIDSTSYKAKAFNQRVRFLVMHYTAGDFKSSMAALTGPNVSAHYVVPDPTDKTYKEAGFTDMRIFKLLDEQKRAWHAGISSWAGRTNLNDTSIGIENVNLAREEHGQIIFPPYNPTQIEAIKQLALDILKRYPDITPRNVVGHSDIAPTRKSDPGAAFPWKELYQAGIGAWYDDATKQKYIDLFKGKVPVKADILAKLSKYGYDISVVKTTVNYKQLIRAFQLHFRQSNYDGNVDVETAAILYALVEKYFG